MVGMRLLLRNIFLFVKKMNIFGYCYFTLLRNGRFTFRNDRKIVKKFPPVPGMLIFIISITNGEFGRWGAELHPS